jgi:hypothetical protein
MMETLLTIIYELGEHFGKSRRCTIGGNFDTNWEKRLPNTLEEAVSGAPRLPLDVWVSLHPLGKAHGLEIVRLTLPDPARGWPVGGYVAKRGSSYGLDALGVAFNIPLTVTAQLLADADQQDGWPVLGNLETARTCLVHSQQARRYTS